MGIRSFEGCTCSVTNSRENLHRLLKHDAKRRVTAITAECCVIVTTDFISVSCNDLNCYLIVTWTIHGPIQAKAHHKDATITAESYPVTGATITPATFHLLKATDCLFFASKTAAWPVKKLDLWFRVDSEMKEHADHFLIC